MYCNGLFILLGLFYRLPVESDNFFVQPNPDPLNVGLETQINKIEIQ